MKRATVWKSEPIDLIQVRIMKILELFGEPIANGGQEAFVMNVIKNIDDESISIDVLTPYYCENDYYKAIVEKKGGRVLSLGLPFSPGNSRLNLTDPLKKFFNSNRYDIVHIHSGSISVLAIAAWVAHRAKIKKIIVHSHCAAERKTIKYRLAKLFSLSIMRRCPTDYCACSQVAGDWKFSKKIAKKKLIILKNGVDLSEFSFDCKVRNEMRRRLGISDDALVVGHVGRFSYQKNHEYLLKILSELKNSHIKAVLMCIGSGELFNDIKEKATRENLLDDIIFVGTVNNVADYMQAMDLFALPSRFEGLPIVGVEAQATGLPCILSDAVTREAALADEVKFLPIDDESVPVWSKEILAVNKSARKDNNSALRDKGFDIRLTVDKLLAIYKGVS